MILMDIFQTMVMLLHILKNVVRKSTISPIYASCKLGIVIIVEKRVYHKLFIRLFFRIGRDKMTASDSKGQANEKVKDK